MLQGILPGSLKAPNQIHSKLLKKRTELFELYKKHFELNLKLSVIQAKADRDPNLASQIYIESNGQVYLHTAVLMNSNYYRDALNTFIQEAKKRDLITDVLGQGVHGLTLVMKENDHDVVIKLPVNPTTDFEANGYIALENEYDHAQRIAAIDNIDHKLVSRPIDQLSIRGKVLAFARFDGKDLFNRDDYNENRIPAFGTYASRQSFEPARIAELIKVYMEAFKAQIPTMSYGSPHNTRLIEDGKAIALFDMCSQPPTQEHDLQQMYIQKSLFGEHALACALFQTLGNGNINLLLDGELGSRFRSGIKNGTSDQGKTFFEYRERLLRESLEVLLNKKEISKDELIANLESLRDVNDRITPDILDYLKFKDDGKLILEGQDLAQRLIDYFRK